MKEYKGEKVTVSWDKRLCIHVGECGRAEGELFEAGRDPWCDPDVTESDNVVDVVKRCPTGALAYTAESGELESADDHNAVVVANNGPLYLRGDLQIDGVEPDMPGVKFRAALCRCGHSKNKPFCDNSHETEGFVDRGAVGSRGPGCEAGGALAINIAANGPLLLNGNFQIVNGSGQVAWSGTKTALCRCGHSKNKPFCDGAHKAAGFEG